MPAVESASRAESKAARSGARAGAKVRERESTENEAAILAALEADRTGKATVWSYTYRAGTNEDGTSDHREARIVERGRREVSASTLLTLCREAAKLAAGRLKARHGIPALSLDEREELTADLACRLIEGANGSVPSRDTLTRAYLVKRAEGIVLDDPDRARADAAADGGDVVALAAAAVEAESESRSKHAVADPMLNPGKGSETASLTEAADAAELPPKARRAAAYMMGGGTVAGDWSLAWETSPGYAKTRIVPEGAAYLRGLDAERAELFRRTLLETSRPDDLDREARAMLARERGERGHLDRARAVKPWRDRIEPGDRIGSSGPAVLESVVMVRHNNSIIVTSERTRARRASEHGWTKPLA